MTVDGIDGVVMAVTVVFALGNVVVELAFGVGSNAMRIRTMDVEALA